MDLSWISSLSWASGEPGLHGESVADECAAFLAGEYGRWCRHHHAPVPPWAVVNGVAHCQLDELRSAGRRSGLPAVRRRQRRRAAELVDELLARCGDDPARLRSLQLDVLVPLELQLARHPRNVAGTGDAVERALHALIAAGR